MTTQWLTELEIVHDERRRKYAYIIFRDKGFESFAKYIVSKNVPLCSNSLRDNFLIKILLDRSIPTTDIIRWWSTPHIRLRPFDPSIIKEHDELLFHISTAIFFRRSQPLISAFLNLYPDFKTYITENRERLSNEGVSEDFLI